MKKTFLIIAYIVLIILTINSCSVNDDVDSPTPTLTDISPNNWVGYSKSFTLTVNGSGFINNTKIIFNGNEIDTTFINSGQLSAEIDRNLLKNEFRDVLNSSYESLQVSVKNSDTGLESLNSRTFYIMHNHIFINPIDILPNGGHSYKNPAIATGGNGEVYIVFENVSSNSSNYSISFIKSTDYGNTWTEPIDIGTINTHCYKGFYPAIAVGPYGDIFVAFNTKNVYFTSLKKGENNWSKIKLIDTQIGAYCSGKPAICVDENNIVSIIYANSVDKNPRGKWHLLYTRSSGDNINFSKPKNIFASWKSDFYYWPEPDHPSIAADGNGNVYANWNMYNRGSLFNSSNDGGRNWNSKDTSINNSEFSNIAIDPSGNICLATENRVNFYDKGTYTRIEFQQSENNGLSFNQISVPSMSPVSSSGEFPKIMIDPYGIYNIIFDKNNRVYYTRSVDKGLNWVPAIPIGPFYTNQLYGTPIDMALDNQGNIYIVYGDSNQLYFVINDDKIYTYNN